MKAPKFGSWLVPVEYTMNRGKLKIQISKLKKNFKLKNFKRPGVEQKHIPWSLLIGAYLEL